MFNSFIVSQLLYKSLDILELLIFTGNLIQILCTCNAAILFGICTVVSLRIYIGKCYKTLVVVRDEPLIMHKKAIPIWNQKCLPNCGRIFNNSEESFLQEKHH